MPDKYYRTFIGVPVKVGDGFLNARKDLIGLLEGERISWVDPGIYHVTIRFLGDTEVSRIEAIATLLEDNIKAPLKMQVFTDRPGSFGPRKRPGVIWIGFGDIPLFGSLRDEVDLALEPFGFPKTDQPFRPHITLGRVRSLRDPGRYYEAIGSMKDRFREKVWLDKLVFYKSEPGPVGPVYSPLYQMDFLSGK